jgi:hypothetical protein
MRSPRKLHPAIDHDEERCRRVALSEQDLVRRQPDRGGRRDDVLDRFRLEAAEDGDAGDDLEASSRGT